VLRMMPARRRQRVRRRVRRLDHGPGRRRRLAAGRAPREWPRRHHRRELLPVQEPVFVGDLLSFYADVVKVGNTSITVYVEVYAERNRLQTTCQGHRSDPDLCRHRRGPQAAPAAAARIADLASKPMQRGAACSCWTRRAWPRPPPRATFAARRAVERAGYPFSLGVASGAPLPDSVILWTRILPDPLEAASAPAIGVPCAGKWRGRGLPQGRRERAAPSPRRSWRTACA
jgi:hypothetical protein